MKELLRILLILVCALLLMAPAAAQNAPERNLTDDCVSDYDAAVDYFPDKVEPIYSVGWKVEYHLNYKVVSVLMPWPGAGEDDVFRYVLVQCGTPIPNGYDNAQIIEVPAGDLITLSTTYLPHLAALNLLQNLIGLDTALYVNTPEVVELAEAGELVEVGSGSIINIELVLDAEPDIVMAYGSGAPEFDSHPVLLDAGIFVAINAEYMETSPLGRAEWIKFTALFYNVEALAEQVFEDKVTQYEQLVGLTADIPDEDRPLLLWDSYTTFGDAWFVPGGNSFSGQLLRDAGARLPLSDDPQVIDAFGSVPFDFEAVYEVALEADIWLPNVFGWSSLDDVLAADERYSDIGAFQRGRVYNNNNRENPNGGNDYYETGVTNPHLILADIVKLLYPDLLPDHELHFYRRLE
jgi:iron complex transport system substrate-binding protein